MEADRAASVCLLGAYKFVYDIRDIAKMGNQILICYSTASYIESHNHFRFIYHFIIPIIITITTLKIFFWL